MAIIWIKRDATQYRVTQRMLTPAQLDQIANILNIPQSERGQLIGGTIHIDVSPPPSPSGGGTTPQRGGGSPSSSGGNPSPSGPAAGGRQSG
jgi:hypothetical protein